MRYFLFLALFISFLPGTSARAEQCTAGMHWDKDLGCVSDDYKHPAQPDATVAGLNPSTEVVNDGTHNDTTQTNQAQH